MFNVRDVYFSLDYTFFTQVCGEKLETLCEEVYMYLSICVHVHSFILIRTILGGECWNLVCSFSGLHNIDCGWHCKSRTYHTTLTRGHTFSHNPHKCAGNITY